MNIYYFWVFVGLALYTIYIMFVCRRFNNTELLYYYIFSAILGPIILIPLLFHSAAHGKDH